MSGLAAVRTRPVRREALALLAGGASAMLAGLTGALVLLGVSMPPAATSLAATHGVLMALGFLGTVIALERAVALDRSWGYLSPGASAAGAMLALTGQPTAAAVAFAVAGLSLLAVYAALARVERSLQLAVQVSGAGAWVLASVVLLAGMPVNLATPWMAAFLVLTVAGERLDLARLGGLPVQGRRLFVVIWVWFMSGISMVAVSPDLGVRLAGTGLLALTVWLVRNDIARRTVRMAGVTRYIALCLLAGYVWLAVAGAVWVVGGLGSAMIWMDLRLHALFLGFVISMVFGHAPVIVPALLRVPLPYKPWFYLHLALLHAGLVVRFAGDALSMPDLRIAGGVMNVSAILLFVCVSAAASVSEARRRRKLVAKGSAARAAAAGATGATGGVA